MSNKKDTTEEMEAMRKTIETMQIEIEQREIEREQREIEYRNEIEARDLQIAEANSRAVTADQKSLKIKALIAEQARNVDHPPTRAGIPGKIFIEHNNFIDYNNIMRKLKLLLSIIQRFQLHHE